MKKKPKKQKNTVSQHKGTNAPADIRAIRFYLILLSMLPNLFIIKGKWSTKLKYYNQISHEKFGISPFKLFVKLSKRAPLKGEGLIGIEIIGEI